ncbi:MAG: hypothetical protein ACREFY_05430, partial [Acetobacteraceae bacterium]
MTVFPPFLAAMSVSGHETGYRRGGFHSSTIVQAGSARQRSGGRRTITRSPGAAAIAIGAV